MSTSCHGRTPICPVTLSQCQWCWPFPLMISRDRSPQLYKETLLLMGHNGWQWIVYIDRCITLRPFQTTSVCVRREKKAIHRLVLLTIAPQIVSKWCVKRCWYSTMEDKDRTIKNQDYWLLFLLLLRVRCIISSPGKRGNHHSNSIMRVPSINTICWGGGPVLKEK